MGIVFLDGQFLPEEEAKISPLDRGFLSGDGIFTTLKVEEGIVHFLPIHLKRLHEQCSQIKLICPEINPEWVRELVLRNGATTGIWKMKIVLSRGEDHCMHLPQKEAFHVFMFIKSFTEIPYKALKTALFPIPVGTAHAKVKSLAHLNRFCVMDYAKQQGCDDAITQMESGILLECAFANFFWKIENKIFIPDSQLPYYFGVTLTVFEQILHLLNYSVQFVKCRLNEIPSEASVYRCNTMTAIRPIAAIQDQMFKRDENFERIMQQEYGLLVQKLSLHVNECLIS